MADGHARVTGKPQAVIVHVDVGTQALGQGVHNASVGRAPVFIFAGLCPYTESGELPGSRTEYMHWLQQAPDQQAIVRQYCRHTAEVRSGLNIKQSIARALQLASTDPKGPVYLCAARETLAEAIRPYSLRSEQWTPLQPSALPVTGVETIASALVEAKRPLVITGYLGRDRRCPEMLVKLADLIPGLRVHDTGGSDMCFPFDHPGSLGFRLSFDECTRDADTILLLNCDVPWIPSINPPPESARIYQVDVDPLNHQIPTSFFPAHGRWRADCYTALQQLTWQLSVSLTAQKARKDPSIVLRQKEQEKAHAARKAAAAKIAEENLGQDHSLNAHNIGTLLRSHLSEDTTFVMEAVTAAQGLSDQLQPRTPGKWIGCGGTGIGWSNGAALGVRMAIDQDDSPTERAKNARASMVVQIVGDGSYMCAAPSSAAWVAAKYRIPILIIVLNNGGKCLKFARSLLRVNTPSRSLTETLACLLTSMD